MSRSDSCFINVNDDITNCYISLYFLRKGAIFFSRHNLSEREQNRVIKDGCLPDMGKVNVLVTFLMAVTKYLTKNNLRGKGFILIPSSEGWSLWYEGRHGGGSLI